MLREEKLFIWDTAGKFAPFAEEAFNGCRHYRQDLIIYSLTQKGEKEPSRLIVKMMPIETAGNGSGKQTYGPMFSLNYRTCPPERLKRICSMMTNRCLQTHEYYVGFGEELTLVNHSPRQLRHVTLWYKRYDPEKECYLGGVAYSAHVFRLHAQEQRVLTPEHYNAGSAKVVTVELDGV